MKWKRAIYQRVVRFANLLETIWFPDPTVRPGLSGKLLAFRVVGRNLGHDVLRVESIRGDRFEMGTIEWSNQWNRPRFKAHPDAVFDQTCIAEIYAAMKGLT